MSGAFVVGGRQLPVRCCLIAASFVRRRCAIMIGFAGWTGSKTSRTVARVVYKRPCRIVVEWARRTRWRLATAQHSRRSSRQFPSELVSATRQNWRSRCCPGVPATSTTTAGHRRPSTTAYCPFGTRTIAFRLRTLTALKRIRCVHGAVNPNPHASTGEDGGNRTNRTPKTVSIFVKYRFKFLWPVGIKKLHFVRLGRLFSYPLEVLFRFFHFVLYILVVNVTISLVNTTLNLSLFDWLKLIYVGIYVFMKNI